MHDRLDPHGMNDDPRLAAALRALPSAAPPQDGWTALAARIHRRRSVRRTVWFTLPAAFAAGIALALAWPQVRPRAPAPTVLADATAARPNAAAAPGIAALQARSRQWQAWVQELDRNGAPLDGRNLARAVALQDRIGLIDLQLSAVRNTQSTAALWHERITLLQQLGLVHLQPYLVADGSAPHAQTVIPL